MATRQKWLEIRTKVTGQYLQEATEAALEQLGAQAVTLSDAGTKPLLEPAPGATPRFATATVAGLFEECARPERLRTALADLVPELTPSDIEHKWQIEHDYVTAWQLALEPLEISSAVWVCPAGTKAPSRAETVIQITPGMAFGSGEHATTRLCLRWLADHRPEGKVVVDYGCGSGILGIAAALMGARTVVCVDHDVQAIDATRANAAANNIEHLIEACPPDQMPDIQADLVLANIVLGPLIALHDRFRDLLGPGGQLILTGILSDQVSSLLKTYSPEFEQVDIKSRDDWRMISTRRRSD